MRGTPVEEWSAYDGPSPPKRTNNREDKRLRFLMHIKRRMDEVKRQLEFLKNMAGSNYEYTPAEASKICDYLDEWVATVKAEFGKTKRSKLREFELDS
jgi:hypothetical protein